MSILYTVISEGSSIFHFGVMIDGLISVGLSYHIVLEPNDFICHGIVLLMYNNRVGAKKYNKEGT